MENLLAFIEFEQFTHYVMSVARSNQDARNEHNQYGDEDGGTQMDQTQEKKENKQIAFIFADNIPLSEILEKKENEDDVLSDIKVKAHRIYNKYVQPGAEFEINVSFESRDQVRSTVGNLGLLLNYESMEMEDLSTVFEDCKMEILRLLITSMIRFQSQPEFDEFRKAKDDKDLILSKSKSSSSSSSVAL